MLLESRFAGSSVLGPPLNLSLCGGIGSVTRASDLKLVVDLVSLDG